MLKPRASSIQLVVRDHGDVLVEAYDYSIGAVEPLGRHLHHTWQIAWSPNAGGEHWVRGAVRVMPPRSISIIAPGEVHAPGQGTWVDDPASFMMAYLTERLFDDVVSDLQGRARGTPSFGSGVIHNDPRLSHLFARAHQWSLSDEPLAHDCAWLAFVTRLMTLHADSGHAMPPGAREPRAVHAVMEVLRNRPTSRITLTDLARLVNITPARLCRAFKHHVGVPPHAYQLRLRIEEAKRLLVKGRPVADIAAATGFADQSHLGRHFKRIVGLAPSRYKSAVS